MKNIMVFNDISGLGNCSMVANLAVFTHLGHNVMPIVTAHYSCQTGFERYHVLPNEKVQIFAQDVLKNSKADSIYVGFCNDVDTLVQVTEVIKNSDGYLLIDPILGDNGKLYPVFDQRYVSQMRQTVQYAQCITPNLTEACLLADVDYNEVIKLQQSPTFLAQVGNIFADFLQKVKCQRAVITGINCGDLVGNVVITDEGIRYVTNQRTPINYSGTGDLFSSVLLGELLLSCNLLQATQLSAIFVGRCASATQNDDRRFGLEFASQLKYLK